MDSIWINCVKDERIEIVIAAKTAGIYIVAIMCRFWGRKGALEIVH
jgi:hypothetical protein